jgi:hypothetical protein
MQTTDEEDARINADIERLKQLINSVANKIGAQPLCFARNCARIPSITGS